MIKEWFTMLNYPLLEQTLKNTASDSLNCTTLYNHSCFESEAAKHSKIITNSNEENFSNFLLK